MNRIILLLVIIFVSSCSYIQARDVNIVKVEPKECEFLGYLDQAFADNRKDGDSKLQRSTIHSGGNTLYLPPDKQEVLAGFKEYVYLSVGSAYLCPETS